MFDNAFTVSYSSVRENLKRSEMESDLATQSPNSDSEEDSRRPKRRKQYVPLYGIVACNLFFFIYFQFFKNHLNNVQLNLL